MNAAFDRKPNVLIVDDNHENLMALEASLRSENINILKATSGNEALAQLLENECAVTLLDVQMPDMDGFETASLIRQNRKTRNVPIIFVTAINKDEKYVRHGYGLGAVDYLFKPLDPGVVVAKVNAFLEIYRQRQELDMRASELENTNAALCRINSKLEVTLRELRVLNADLENFASIASHDLREPLRNVRSALQILQKKNEATLDAKSRELIRFAMDSTGRMNALICDLLEYARAGTKTFEMQSVDCGRVLDVALENLELAIQEADVQIGRSPLPVLPADPTQLLQLFQNLLSNAVKFRRDEGPAVRVRATDAGEDWVLAFQDNGIGIPDDARHRIFDLFQRLHAGTHIDGTGIGLAVCRRIVERHGGKIWVESKLGEGSTFFVSLPKRAA